MSGAFQYRPKFVDIRVRPPKEGEQERANDVHALKPGERPCEHAECRAAATARAPKSRERMHEHYWFCQAHAADEWVALADLDWAIELFRAVIAR
jgi:hypothetical protein